MDTRRPDEKIEQLLKTRFVPGNDLSRDRERETSRATDERASLLIHSTIDSPSRMVTLLGTGKPIPGGLLITPFPEWVAQRTGDEEHWPTGIVIGHPRPDENAFVQGNPVSPRWDDPEACPGLSFAQASFFWKEPPRIEAALGGIPLHDLCQRLGHYHKCSDSICRHFKGGASPYGLARLPTSKLRPTTFSDKDYGHTDLAAGADPKDWDETGIDWLFRSYLEGVGPRKLLYGTDLHGQLAPGWVPVIPFVDEDGQTIQKLTTHFLPDNGRKALVPVSIWEENGRPDRVVALTPRPGKQPLLHLDLLKQRPNRPVILTDSPEIAYLNQRGSGFVWTSFLCDGRQPDQVDWSPLKGRDVYILVTNHSDTPLPEVYLQIEELADYLTSEDGPGIELRFVQVKVDYPKPPVRCSGLCDLIAHLSTQPGTVVQDSIRAMDIDEFRRGAAAARDYLDHPFYLRVRNDVEPDETDRPPLPVAEGYDMMLRPVVERGAITLIHAMQECGKTALLYSIAGAVISGTPLFPGRWWTVPKWCRGTVVVYLDHETAEGKIEGRKRSFLYPYLSSKEAEREEQMKRFRHVCLRGIHLDYSQPENHGKLLELVEGKIKDVEPGTPVLIMIDTFRNLIGGHEDNCDWSRVKPLLDALARGRRAVLVSHHSNAEGESSGSLDKLRDVDYVFSIREIKGMQKGNLEHPRSILVEKTKEGGISSDRTEFAISHCRGTKDGDLLPDGRKGAMRRWQAVAMELEGTNAGKWNVLSNDGQPGLKLLQDLVNEYRQLGLPWKKEHLYGLFDISNGWFYQHGMKMPKMDGDEG